MRRWMSTLKHTAQAITSRSPHPITLMVSTAVNVFFCFKHIQSRDYLSGQSAAPSQQYTG